MGFWDEITSLQGQTLRTLDQAKQFDVLDVFRSGVNIKIHSSGKERLVPREEIEGAYRELTTFGQITRSRIEEIHSPRNPVYVAALLAELSQVSYSIRPIVLRYSKEKNVE